MPLRDHSNHAFSLFLSPHPDDLVYSAFSALRKAPSFSKAIVFFNVSRFTRLGLLPTSATSLIRTFEDKVVLRLLSVKSKHLFLPDYSARDFSSEPPNVRPLILKREPAQLYCPLGVGDHPDHIAVRDLVIDYWIQCKKRPKLRFYEDLPYAARFQEPIRAEKQIALKIANRCGQLVLDCSPLTQKEFVEKIRFCNLYFTQNNHTEEFAKHAKLVGETCGATYAERLYSTIV